jgi:hypothetical protein
VRLWSGGYVPFVSRTGQIEFWVETDLTRGVSLNVAPGEIYYVRVDEVVEAERLAAEWLAPSLEPHR